jgi:UV excision repair protein RAD23
MPRIFISDGQNKCGSTKEWVQGGGEGMAPPGQITVELTAEDDAAVGRLEALGFSRMACVQAYIACERSEELAANYLLENATDEDMQ